MRSFMAWCAGITIGIASTASQAQVIVGIPDNSFEGITTTIESPAGGGTMAGAIGAWSVSATGVIGQQASISSGDSLGGPVVTDGSFDARVILPLSAGAGVTLEQTLSAGFQANSRYTLSVQLDDGASAGLLSGAAIELRAGNTTVASLDGSQLLLLVDTTSGFQTVSLDYTTTASPPLENIGIYFAAASSASVAGSIYLDDFSLTVSPVPEPSTAALLSIGGVLLAGTWLRQRQPAPRL